MINQQFGVYLVLEKNIQLSQQKKRIYWKCECQKCKSIQNVRTDSLKRLPNSCPKCKNSLLGKRFGKLLVLEKEKQIIMDMLIGYANVIVEIKKKLMDQI